MREKAEQKSVNNTANKMVALKKNYNNVTNACNVAEKAFQLPPIWHGFNLFISSLCTLFFFELFKCSFFAALHTTGLR